MSTPIKDEVTYKDFAKLDLRVGTILSVEDVEGSNKLVELTVDFGDFTRHILCGMHEDRENPKEVEGLQAIFLVNLKPAKMAGKLSEGMIIDCGFEDGLRPAQLAVPYQSVPNGTRIG